MNQNSLQCAERNGNVATITQIVKDRLDTRTPTATRDEISVSNKILTCMFTEVNKRGLSCIEYLANIARTLGLEFFNPLPSGRRTDWPYTHLIDKCSKKA
jgi:hypothetical protein